MAREGKTLPLRVDWTPGVCFLAGALPLRFYWTPVVCFFGWSTGMFVSLRTWQEHWDVWFLTYCLKLQEFDVR